MAMFGTTQGTPQTNVTRDERVGKVPTGSSPGAGERPKPSASSVGKPNDQPIR